MPAWRQGQAVGEWRQIPGSAMSSAPIAVPTYPSLGYGPQSKVTAWNGFAVDTRDSSIYSAANGGHTDYAGNEVDRIRLSDNAPGWTEPRASTPPSQVVASATHYADGRPTSRHSCYGSAVNEVRNRVMILGGSRYGSGYMLGTVDGFSLTGGDWDTASTYPDAPDELPSTPCPAITAHKSSGDLYLFANWNVLRWSNSANSWARVLTSTSVYGQYAASALDTKRNRILVVAGNSDDHGFYDVTSNTVQNITLSGPNASAITGEGNGMVYDPYLDVFLLRKPDAGNTIYRINAQTFAVDTLPVSGGTSVPAAVNGVWSRILYVPKLNGFVYIPEYGSNAWFVRTY